MKYYLFAFFLVVSTFVKAQLSFHFDKNKTLELKELIEEYQSLDKRYDNALFLKIGQSDAGLPIHCFIIGKDPISSIDEISKPVILINNGIHPGESCGVDASLLFAQECLLKNPSFLDSITIAIIPMYNIGGSLNRREQTRANQNGPIGQGFRGNARHLDLNRDFLKADAKNTFTFYKVFQLLNPLIFIDTHSTNGADYQYQQTLIVSPPEKIGKDWEVFVNQVINPEVFNYLEQNNIPSTFYVNVHGHSPEHGYSVFEETPIYSSGYTSLYSCLSVVSETHMLKPYHERVKSTFFTLLAYSKVLANHSKALKKKWNQSNKKRFTTGYLPLNYQIDSSNVDTLIFKGYEMEKTPSIVYSGERRSFNQAKPFEKKIQFYGHLKPIDSTKIPQYFYLSVGQYEVLKRIYAQGITGDTVNLPLKKVFTEYISEINYSTKVYEGHVTAHKIISKPIEWKGGYYLPVVKIKVNALNYRYLLNVLTTDGPGSFYKWNFFDSYYQQKEWFSDYLYEDHVENHIKDSTEFKIIPIKNPDEAYHVLYQFYKKDSNLFERDAYTPPVFFSF